LEGLGASRKVEGALVARELVRDYFATPEAYEEFVEGLRQDTFQEAAFGKAWSFQEG
jgi:hypothetical protein